MAQKKDETAQNNEALATKTSTFLAFNLESRNLQEAIRENFGAAMRLQDLDKVSVPSGGALSWELPNITSDTGFKTESQIIGIIVGWGDKKAWWADNFADSGGNMPPDCRSEDMVHGLGNPNLKLNAKESAMIAASQINAAPPRDGKAGWICAGCPHNVFGTAENGEGKACKDMRFLLILPQDALIPILLRVPPTSIKACRNYFKRLTSSGKPFYGVVTSLGLQKETSGGNIKYSSITFKAARFLEKEEIERARAYNETVKKLVASPDFTQQAFSEKASEEEEEVLDREYVAETDEGTSAEAPDSRIPF